MARAGLNQSTLAVAADVSRETVWRILNGKGRPSENTIRRLAKAVGAAPPAGVGGTEGPERPTGVTPADEDMSEAEEQVRTLLREAERTVAAHVGDPETVGRDFLRQLRTVMVDQFIEQARESGRAVPPFLYQLRYELDKDLFR